jgi:hypothetical protein
MSAEGREEAQPQAGGSLRLLPRDFDAPMSAEGREEAQPQPEVFHD